MDIDEVPLLEELMDGHGGQAPDTEHCLEGVGAGAKMGNGAQEFHAVPLGLQGIISGGGALYGDGLRLNLKGLLGLGGEHQLALHDQGSADVNFGNFLEIRKGIVIDNLDRIEVSTVIQDDKAKLLASPAVSYPTAYFNFLTGVFFGVAEQFSHGNQFHNGVLSFI